MKWRRHIIYAITVFIIFFSLTLETHIDWTNWSWWITMIGIIIIAGNEHG